MVEFCVHPEQHTGFTQETAFIHFSEFEGFDQRPEKAFLLIIPYNGGKIMAETRLDDAVVEVQDDIAEITYQGPYHATISPATRRGVRRSQFPDRVMVFVSLSGTEKSKKDE
jgi:hypothetical protein